jgi:ABC-type enterochelin transport system substrate-binding protein
MSQELTTLQQNKENFKLLQEMCATPGWKLWVEQNKKQYELDASNAPFVFKTAEEFHYFRGHANSISKILGFEDYVTQLLTDIEEEIADISDPAEEATDAADLL